jgi:predicted ribosomally synthesized peptide with nif11-like leader
MSKETVIKFFTAVDKSPELQRQIRPLDEQGDSRDGAKKMLEIAAKAGYAFSLEDLRDVVKDRNEQMMPSSELSERDLEQVAGGRGAAGCVCTEECCYTKCQVTSG